MANEHLVTLLREMRDQIANINLDRVFRPYLGTVSLAEPNKDQVHYLIKIFHDAAEVAPVIPSNVANSIKGLSDKFLADLQRLASHTDEIYVSSKAEFQSALDSLSEQLSSLLPSVTHAMLEQQGILDAKGTALLQQIVEDTRVDIKSMLPTLVKEEADRAIQEAWTLASSIEARARNTATGISIKEAQKQFSDATKADWVQVGVWGVFGIVALAYFFYIASGYASEAVKLPVAWSWQFGYITALHASILAAVGTIAGFSLKNTRASLHMLNHNLHRKRITNSIAAFVQSAQTPEQRDMILMRLVDSVSAFGQSGLVSADADSGRPTLSIDSISRSLGGTAEKNGKHA